ncbi:leucine-rich repeat-containing protein 70-like [Culicoides brevitarsis]|uniref:leucine-rich repeat-containing protein 70-like n=1 Tax=Culicoides brevitarsis TaxID=469753 RepID=UPI00307C287A
MTQINFNGNHVLSNLVTSKSLPVYTCERFENSCTFNHVNLTLTDYKWQPAAEDPETIELVRFFSSNIPVVYDNICKTFPSLKNFQVIRQGVHEITEDAFHSCKNLQALIFANNFIKKLPPNIFKGLTNLEHIEISDNQLQGFSTPDLFSDLPKLKALYLEVNNITQLPADMFKTNQKLQYLWMSSNDLSDIEVEKFLEYLPELQNFYINDNEISCARAVDIIKILEDKRMKYNNLYELKVRYYSKEVVFDRFTCVPDVSWMAAHYRKENSKIIEYMKDNEKNLNEKIKLLEEKLSSFEKIEEALEKLIELSQK